MGLLVTLSTRAVSLRALMNDFTRMNPIMRSIGMTKRIQMTLYTATPIVEVTMKLAQIVYLIELQNY